MQTLKTLKAVAKTFLVVTGVYFVLYYLDYKEIGKDIKRAKRAKRRWF